MQSKVIKKFIKPILYYEESSPPNALELLNACVESATDGQYMTYSSIVSEFIDSYNSYEDKTKFLFVECGIDLTNSDSGSIIGSDAGGIYTINMSFVSESGLLQSAPSEFMVQGLTFHCPSNMSENEQWICDALYTWWADDILSKIKDAYSVSIDNKSYIHDIDIVFIPPDSFSSGTIVGATVVTSFSKTSGRPVKLELTIPRAWANNIDKIDDIGKYTGNINEGLWLDSIIAHELTHAVLSANTYWYTEMPNIVVEGTAEVFCGADVREPTYLSDLANSITSLNTELVGKDGVSSDKYTVAATFLRWFAKKFNTNDSEKIGSYLIGTPFLNKLIYSIILYDKFYADVAVIINLAIQYATKLTGIKITYIQFIQEYVEKLDTSSIDQSLLDIANIDFTNQDCGAYGGLDSKFVDYVIKRQDRFRILNIFSYLNQADTLYYSFSYYAKYEKNEYKVRYLTIIFTDITSSTVNAYYKKSIISRLVRGVFKPVLQCLDYYLNLRFDAFSFCRTIHIDFDDDPTPIRPCRYQVGFDENGKVNSMLITFYTHAYIPIDDRDTMPAMGYYTGNYLLYIFCIFIILSKLNNAQAFYRHPIIVAIAITLVGYDELGEEDIKQTAINGKTEEYAVGGIIGD